MNTANLHSLIDRYEENFYTLNNSEHDEIFKWRAAKRFRDVWFSEEAKTMTFSEKFAAAKKEFSILMDNSYVSPSNGIVKIAATKVSAGVSTGIGDHESKYSGKESDGAQGDEQFEIDDNRSLEKMYQDISQEGLQPVLNDYLYV